MKVVIDVAKCTGCYSASCKMNIGKDWTHMLNLSRNRTLLDENK